MAGSVRTPPTDVLELRGCEELAVPVLEHAVVELRQRVSLLNAARFSAVPKVSSISARRAACGLLPATSTLRLEALLLLQGAGRSSVALP